MLTARPTARRPRWFPDQGVCAEDVRVSEPIVSRMYVHGLFFSEDSDSPDWVRPTPDLLVRRAVTGTGVQV